MSQPIARVGDTVTGICLQHGGGPRAWTGTIAVGSCGFKVNGQDVAGEGDTGNTNCGHMFIINSGSSIATGNGKAIARKTDTVIVVGGGFGEITSVGQTSHTCA